MTVFYMRAACRPFEPKGANPSSHGETIAGLDRLLPMRNEEVAPAEDLIFTVFGAD
jgi:hypothetical protein